MGFAHSQAVIVGSNNYSNGIRNLRSAVSDAEELVHLLESTHGYSVEALRNAEATRDKLKAHFEDALPQQLGPDDRLIIFFAGHGIAENDDNGSSGYLLPEDACVDERNIFLDMATFRRWVELIRCWHLLVILDCCFAGAFRWTKETRHVLRWTLSLLRIASQPRPTVKWVLPVPGGPSKSTASPCATQRHLASSRI